MANPKRKDKAADRRLAREVVKLIRSNSWSSYYAPDVEKLEKLLSAARVERKRKGKR